MSWVKLDDQIFAHPKIINLSKDAKLLHLAALSYCAGQLTDGLLTPGAIRMAAAQVDVDASTCVTCVDELVDALLWEPDVQDVHGRNYHIHDYLKYNPPAEKVIAEREANTRRQEAYRQRRDQRNGTSNGGSNGVTNGSGNGVSHGVTNSVPSPSPISDPPVDTFGGDTSRERMAPAASAAPTRGALALSASPAPAQSTQPQTPARAPANGHPRLVPLPSPSPAPLSAKRSRAPDPLWDACVAACDGDGAGPSNSVERGKWNKGLSGLRQSGATPEEIALRASRYRRRYGPDIPLNPMALASNWTILAQEVTHHATTADRAAANAAADAAADASAYPRRSHSVGGPGGSGRRTTRTPEPLPDADEFREWARRRCAEGATNIIGDF